MKLESFGIANFKAFGSDIQRMPLKPITLVFGPNSAGKSSALHSLLWLHHGLSTGKVDVRFPECGSGQIDLGGFAQTLHRHDSERRIVVEMIFPKSELPEPIRSFWWIEKDVALDLSFGRTTNSQNQSFDLVDYRLRIDGTDFLTAIRKGGCLTVSTLRLDHQTVADRIGQLSSRASKESRPPLQLADLESMSAEEAVDRFAENQREAAGGEAEMERLGDVIAEAYKLECPNLLPNGISYHGIAAGDDFWDVILPKRLDELVRGIADGALAAMASLRYVPPLRELPPRYFDLNESDVIWQRLFDDDSMSQRVNSWLASEAFHTKYELHIAEYLSQTAIERELPTLIRSEIGRVIISRPDGADSFSEELEFVIAELQEKFSKADIEEFLRSQPDLFNSVMDREVEYVCDHDEFVIPHPSGKSPNELTDDDVRLHLDSHWNWEAWVGGDALKNGDMDAVELFRRWAEVQPLLLELLDHHGDPSQATARFLRGKQFGQREVRREILLRHKNNKTEVSLQDVGVGVSQVLPVILHAFGEKEKLIAIEQPEIHIHPALQAELGDVFIESALGENKNTFLIETHSEHLILRILRRIRETTRGKLPEEAIPVRSEDIAVLYVEPGDEGSTVRVLRINDQGRFVDDWPNGFFEERFNEEF